MTACGPRAPSSHAREQRRASGSGSIADRRTAGDNRCNALRNRIAASSSIAAANRNTRDRDLFRNAERIQQRHKSSPMVSIGKRRRNFLRRPAPRVSVAIHACPPCRTTACTTSPALAFPPISWIRPA